ncbi:MAG: dihydrolipoyl dehydrogenase [Granulosicoccus sp.]
MSELQTIKIPDIGDVDDVEIIEVLVAVGDTVDVEMSLVTVESDKASMEIPSPTAGVITSLLVKTGDRVSEGSDIVVLDVASVATDKEPDSGNAQSAQTTSTKPEPASAPAAAKSANERSPASNKSIATSPDADAAYKATDERYDLVVLGAGPGGYTSAFRAADLGLKVLLVERYPDLGGVCLNVGCIPSKALLHTAAIIQETQEMAAHGVSFGKPQIDVNKLRGFKEEVIGKLTGGLASLAKQRKVSVAHGFATFKSPHALQIKSDQDDTPRVVGFTHAVVAAGSKSIRIPGFPYDDPRLMDSTGALALADIPKRLLVIGGGIIGLEMGCVYAGLGSQVTVVELSAGLMPGCDRDLVRPLEKRLKNEFENIFTGSKVTGMSAGDDGLTVQFEGGKAPESDTFDRVLLAVGRSPNGASVAAENAGVDVDERGFIHVDSQQRTNVAHIFAIGDVVGQPMLAHKATHEGKVAAEVAAGQKSYFDAKTIPSVAYTDPEVAWMGLTETAAKEQGVTYEKGSFPWAASGRSLSMGRNEGLTKVLYDPDTKKVLGAGMVGPNAGELVAEAVLALEMGADIEDLALTVHPHPTLSETLNFAAEVAEGTVTDIYVPKKTR